MTPRRSSVGGPFVLVGWGYRSAAWLEAARGIGLDCAGVVVRTPRATPIPAFGSLDDALDATGARFVVASVSPDSAPGVIRSAVSRGVPILSETPPAGDADALRSLWEDVSASGRVQVGEQYPRYPSHAARLALVASGVIGTPTQAQVSSTQLHHAVALMRAYLGVAPGPMRVLATTTRAPLLQPLSRAGDGGGRSRSRHHHARRPRLRLGAQRRLRLHRRPDPQPVAIPPVGRARDPR